jgi:hypothetical protein
MFSLLILLFAGEVRALNLTLNVPTSGTESSTVAGLVSVDGGTNHPPLTVYLASGNTNRVAVTASVVIAPGESSAVFDLVLVNNDWIEEGVNVVIEAWLEDFIGDLDVLRVDDDESRTLALALPPLAAEGQGPMVNGGTISLAGRTTTNVVLALVSDRPQLMTVPALVTIMAGASNASFTLTCNDVGMTNTSESVPVRASGPGFLATTSTVTVLGLKPLKPALPSPLDLRPNVASAGTKLSWTTSTNLPTGTVYDVYFGTNANPTTLVGSTSSNAWALPLLAPLTTYYWRVVTRSTITVAGPVWQFTTRGVAYLRMSPVASLQVAGVPFSVTVSAWDELDRLVPNFTGPVALSGVLTHFFSETILPAPVHNVIGTGGYSVGYEFIPNTNITVTAVRSYFGATVTIWNQAGISLASRGVVGSGWSETPLLTPLQLTAGERYKVSYYRDLGHHWTTNAPPTFPHGVITQSYKALGTGQPTNPDPARWFLVDLRYFVRSAAHLFSPTNSGNFIDGAWTGNVTAWEPAMTLALRATPPVGFGSPAQGNTFLVAATNQPPLILSQPASAQTTRGAFTNFSITVLATPPISYQWRRGGLNLVDNGRISGATTATLLIEDAMESDAGLYSVLVSNAFGATLSSNASLTVSGSFDSDGDGASDRDEHLAGTDPTNALSVLKIILSATNQTVLTFIAQSNLSYSVQWRTNVFVPTWKNLTSVTATASVRTILVDTATAPAAERYFRVVTPSVP